jgi:hypothetical protein
MQMLTKNGNSHVFSKLTGRLLLDGLSRCDDVHSDELKMETNIV